MFYEWVQEKQADCIYTNPLLFFSKIKARVKFPEMQIQWNRGYSLKLIAGVFNLQWNCPFSILVASENPHNLMRPTVGKLYLQQKGEVVLQVSCSSAVSQEEIFF